jgi:hypothetical protein
VLGYFDSGLTAGVTYWFQVAAHNAAGFSAPSIAASAVPVTVPGPPTLLTATPLNDQLTLSWHAPWSDGGLPIGVYQVDVATSANGPWDERGVDAEPAARRARGAAGEDVLLQDPGPQRRGLGLVRRRIRHRPAESAGSPRIAAWKDNGPVVMQTAVWTPGTTYDADLPTGDPFARYEIYVEAFNKVGVGPVCDVPVWMYDA